MPINIKNTQETGKPDKSSIPATGILTSNNGDKPMVTDNINSKINYFIPGPQQATEFKDAFAWIGCFNEAFSLQMKLDSKPCHAPSGI